MSFQNQCFEEVSRREVMAASNCTHVNSPSLIISIYLYQVQKLETAVCFWYSVLRQVWVHQHTAVHSFIPLFTMMLGAFAAQLPSSVTPLSLIRPKDARAWTSRPDVLTNCPYGSNKILPLLGVSVFAVALVDCLRC